MITQNKLFLFFCTVFFITSFAHLWGITLTVTGSWPLSIGSADVIGGTGGNLSPEYLSSSDIVTIEIADTAGASDAWQVLVHREDGLWKGSLSLGLIRTTSGTGPGAVTGGDSGFLELTAGDQLFFEGTGDRSAIDVRMRLSGVSAVLNAEVYSRTVYFTVIDIP